MPTESRVKSLELALARLIGGAWAVTDVAPDYKPFKDNLRCFARMAQETLEES